LIQNEIIKGLQTWQSGKDSQTTATSSDAAK